jgi:predicted nucleotidyltransferase
MDLINPMQSVIPSAQGAVLSALARTDEPLSGRRVAELTRPKFAQTRVNAVLQKLADSGIVLRERRPPANLYRLNKQHVATDGILMLADMWASVLSRIRAELADWSVRPEAAWLFGSAARREARAESDIDILVVVPAGAMQNEGTSTVWQLQTDALAENIKAWTGNSCEVLEMDAVELEAAVERDDRLIRDLRDQAVVLAGDDARIACGGRSTDDPVRPGAEAPFQGPGVS